MAADRALRRKLKDYLNFPHSVAMGVAPEHGYRDADVLDEVIVPTFNDLGTCEESDEGTANVPTGTKSVFTERLLREILDLDAGQQLELCGYLAKGSQW